MKIPRDQIKKFAVIDDNTLVSFAVENFEIGETKGGPGSKLPAGCKMYRVQLRVLEPEKDADMMLFDNFVVGTADDPSAEDPETWTSNRAMGARRLNEFLLAIGITSDDDEQWAEQAIDQQGQGLVIIETPESGSYKGVPQNRVKEYFAVGQAPVQQTGKVAAKPAAVRPAAPTAAQPKAVSVAPARRVAQPPAPAGPNGPAATAQRPSAAKPATVSKSAQAIPCVLCQDAGEANFMVPRAEFQGHYAQHLAQQTSGEE